MGYRLVDVSVRRPVPGHFEVAQFTYQAGHQRAERAAPGDRVPPAALADAPPEAAPARGDLSWPADSEPAPAVHAPHGKARCAGRQAFNRLIKPTHRRGYGYPARTLPCLDSSTSGLTTTRPHRKIHRPGFLAGARGRVTRWVTITTGSSGRQRTSTDSASQVRHAGALRRVPARSRRGTVRPVAGRDRPD